MCYPNGAFGYGGESEISIQCGGVVCVARCVRSERENGDWGSSLYHVLVVYIKTLFDWHPRSGSSTCLCIGESVVFFKGSVVPKRTCLSKHI